jgi:hypothetical protein
MNDDERLITNKDDWKLDLEMMSVKCKKNSFSQRRYKETANWIINSNLWKEIAIFFHNVFFSIDEFDEWLIKSSDIWVYHLPSSWDVRLNNVQYMWKMLIRQPINSSNFHVFFLGQTSINIIKEIFFYCANANHRKTAHENVFIIYWKLHNEPQLRYIFLL